MKTAFEVVVIFAALVGLGRLAVFFGGGRMWLTWTLMIVSLLILASGIMVLAANPDRVANMWTGIALFWAGGVGMILVPIFGGPTR